MSPSSSSRTPACAACRHHRTRCAPDCPLAPFFPANLKVEFRNARKLFGVSNMLRILYKSELTPQERDEAVKSIIYEANARVADPVRGCAGWIAVLEQRIKLVERELELVTQRLDFYRKKCEAGEMDGVVVSSDLLGDCVENHVPVLPEYGDGLQYSDSGVVTD